MDHQGVSGEASNSSVEIHADKRWLGTLLCCLSALVTTVVIVLVANAFMSTDDRDIARGDSEIIDHALPTSGGIPD